jgi:hypothetical protein
MGRKWDSFDSICKFYCNLASPNAGRNTIRSSNVPFKNLVITARTKLKKNVYDLCMQSKIPDHEDKAFKTGIQYCNKNCKKQTTFII